MARISRSKVALKVISLRRFWISFGVFGNALALDRVDLHQQDIVGAGAVKQRVQRRIAHVAAIPVGHAVDFDRLEHGRQAGRGHDMVGRQVLALKTLRPCPSRHWLR
jgi:hypothetical protein